MTDNMRCDGWTEYIGQQNIKAELKVRIEAALLTRKPMKHTLLTGPPGFGKTSLARIIADELNEPFESVTMPITSSALRSLVMQFEGVLLLDEIHRATPKQQEELLPLLEFNHLQVNGRKVEAGWLTVVGATTERQKVISPLFDRFRCKPEFDPYSDEEMADIVRGMARKVEIDLPEETIAALGRASVGTPRIAAMLVETAADIAVTKAGVVPPAEDVLALCRIDDDGLSVQHVRYLEILHDLGGQGGLKTLSSLLRLNEGVVQEVERILIEKGLLNLTDKGRVLTRAAYNKLKESNC